jgi:hypothetical protein
MRKIGAKEYVFNISDYGLNIGKTYLEHAQGSKIFRIFNDGIPDLQVLHVTRAEPEHWRRCSFLSHDCMGRWHFCLKKIQLDAERSEVGFCFVLDICFCLSRYCLVICLVCCVVVSVLCLKSGFQR